MTDSDQQEAPKRVTKKVAKRSAKPKSKAGSKPASKPRSKTTSKTKTVAEPRAQWRSSTLFVLAVSGATVGVSNISLFPIMVAENGGGSFMVLYLLALLLVGFPMMVLEMLIGRNKAANPVTAVQSLAQDEQRTPKWGWLSIIGVVASLLILSFYSVIAGWSIAYMFRMVSGAFVGLNELAASNVFTDLITDAERLIAWHTIFILIVAHIVARGIKRGIERWVRILVPLFFILLIILSICAALVSPMDDVVQYFFVFKWEALQNPNTIFAALAMAFFSLALGRGAVMTFASYLPKKESIVRSAASVIALDFVVIILAGLAIFPIVLGSGFDFDENLIFQKLPLAYQALPFGRLLGFLFFTTVLVAAITSAIALLEPVVAWMSEKEGATRKKIATKCGMLVWVLGLGTIFSLSIWSEYTWTLELDFNQLQILLFKDQSFFNIVEYVSSKLLVPISGLFLLIFAGHVMKPDVLKDELKGHEVFFKIWYFVIQYIAPLAVFVVLLNAIGLLA